MIGRSSVRQGPTRAALAAVRSAAFFAALLLSSCAQPLGPTRGDPTVGAGAPPVARSDASAKDEAAKRTQRSSATPATAQARSGEAMRPGKTITVGPGGDVPTLAQAAKRARDGDTVEVQAGEYRGDVAVWTQKRLTIRAVGGRAVLIADGKSAEGKGIWVIRNGHFEVEGFDFVGARVPDRNGAGIRFDHGTLVVRDSRFIDNENGILTSNDGVSTLVIERSLFSRNGHGDGYSHGVYAGKIARLEVRASWFRHGRVGHLLKTRARENEILYNRLTDEDGNASYELEFPNGGRALVVGNVIEQSSKTQNPVIVSFGAERYRWPVNELVMSHNTVVNSGAKNAVFVRVAAGNARATLVDNVWAGTGDLLVPAPSVDEGNRRVPLAALREPASGDYRLAETAPFERSGTTADAPTQWTPRYQYRHERGMVSLSGAPSLPGAFQE